MDMTEDIDDNIIKESLYSMSESEINSFVDSLNESELNVLLSIVESDEYLMEGIGSKIKSGLKKTGGLVKRTVKGTVKDVARYTGRGISTAAGAGVGLAVGGIPGGVVGAAAGNMAYQAGKDAIKKKLANRKMKKITEGILNNNFVQAKDAFYEEVNRRIELKLEEKRQEILSEKKWKHSGTLGTIGGIAGTVAGAGTLNPALAVAGGAAGLAAGEAAEYAGKKIGRFVKNKYLRRKRKKAQAIKVKNNGR